MDEGFEILTLMQTGKMPIVPVVMVDRPGGNYWEVWRRFLRQDLLERGYVSDEDFHLFHLSHGVEEAMAHVDRFYRNFNGYGVEGGTTEVWLRRALRTESLDQLNGMFGGLLERGTITQESAGPDGAGSVGRGSWKLRFVPKVRQAGNLRRLIDATNVLATVAGDPDDGGGDGGAP